MAKSKIDKFNTAHPVGSLVEVLGEAGEVIGRARTVCRAFGEAMPLVELDAVKKFCPLDKLRPVGRPEAGGRIVFRLDGRVGDAARALGIEFAYDVEARVRAGFERLTPEAVLLEGISVAANNPPAGVDARAWLRFTQSLEAVMNQRLSHDQVMAERLEDWACRENQ